MRIPSSVMDAPASEAEIEQARAQQEEDSQSLEDIEREIAEAKDDSYDANPFAGADAAACRERRLSRGTYTDADLEPEPEDPFASYIDTYQGPTEGADVRTEDEYSAFLDFHIAKGVEKFGDAFVEKINRYIAPQFILEGVDRADIQRAVLRRPDILERAYNIALRLEREAESGVPSRRQIAEMTGELLDELNQSAMGQQEEQPQPLSRGEMRRLNKLPLADFARALDALKSK